MLEHTLTCRVHYSETDQMGYVHHSNYARYYENARWEFFREIGVVYSEIEQSGTLMPVVKMNARFIKPLRYDEEFTIVTIIEKLPTSTFPIKSIIFNEKEEMVHEATVTLAFVCNKSRKACRPPAVLIDALSDIFLTE